MSEIDNSYDNLEIDLSAPSSQVVTVETKTSDGTAIANTDYTAQATQTIFQPGQTSQTISVHIPDDGPDDDGGGNQYFYVSLSDPTNATISQPSTATVTIDEGSGGPGDLISGVVWQDGDHDGILDNGETGLAGITVTLEVENLQGVVLGSPTTTTDINGNYAFNLPQNTSAYQFQIYVAIPSGYAATQEYASSSGIVSDINSAGYSNVFTLTNGNAVVNAGLINETVGGGILSTQPDSYSVLHDQVLDVGADNGVLANDSDSDGDQLTAALVSGPSYGTLQFNPDGSFTYTPNAGYAGNDSFQYTASDGSTTSSPTTATIAVTDNAPVAVNHTYGVPENTTENVTAATGLLNGASDADGDPLTASLVAGSGPSHGSVTVNSDGSFTYTPTNGYIGSDSFQYAVSDGIESTDATVTLNVHAGDTAPVANADSYSMMHDSALSEDASGGVLANDTDADGDPLTASLVSGPSYGTLTLNPDGSFTYTPNAGWTGTDSFTYTASDGLLPSSPATATISVTDANAPVANDDSYSVASNSQFSTVDFDVPDADPGVLANDSDADGDLLTASLVSGPSNGTLQFNPDGTFTYTPNSGFLGTDSFTYTASDGLLTSNAATVTINVIAAPVAANDSYTVIHDQTLNADSSTGVLANDSDAAGDPLIASLVSDVSNGTLALNDDGTFTYTPNPGFVGTDSFTYTADDDVMISNTATVTINVTNQTPVANNDSYELLHDTSLSVNAVSGLLANDTDADGDALTVTINPDVSNGILVYSGNDGSFLTSPIRGSWAQTASPTRPATASSAAPRPP